MKRAELLLDIPTLGDVLLEPFSYNNGRDGYMYITRIGTFNLTLNVDGVDVDLMILKMYDEAEIVSRHLLNKTDMFKKIDIVNVGRNFGQSVILNEDYYEK